MRRPLPAAYALLAVVALLPVPAGAQGDRGDWTITPRRDQRGSLSRDTVQLTIIRDENSTNGFPISLTRFGDLSRDALRGPPSTARFHIVSDAGTVTFTGNVGGGSGSGEFSFTSNRAFVDALRRRNVPGIATDEDLFRLAVTGTTTASIDRLLGALRRYDDAVPSASEFARFSTHAITEATISELGEAGMRRLEPEEIVRLVNHGVDGRYVREWSDAGYPNLDAEQLVRLRNHDVTPEWAQQVNQRSSSRVDVDRLVRMRRGR